MHCVSGISSFFLSHLAMLQLRRGSSEIQCLPAYSCPSTAQLGQTICGLASDHRAASEPWREKTVPHFRDRNGVLSTYQALAGHPSTSPHDTGPHPDKASILRREAHVVELSSITRWLAPDCGTEQPDRWPGHRPVKS